jgi:hypothetical protein
VSVKNRRKFLLVLGILQTATMTLSAAPGADISLSRRSFLMGENSDFLGVFAGWFYSIIPDQPLGWGANMTFVQMTCILVAIQIEAEKFIKTRTTFVALIVVQYLSLFFSAQQSRDGSLFAFLFLGLSLLRKYCRAPFARRNPIYLCLSVFLIILGLSFRPWMSPLTLPLILFIFGDRLRNKVVSKLFVGCFVLVAITTPLLVESGMSRILDVKKNYPLQTLIIHDLVTSACWSANIKTSEASLSALEPLAVNQDYSESICQFYRPNTWQSVTGASPESSLTSQLEHPIAITNSQKVYSDLVSDWLSILSRDPKTFVQNKLMLSSQVVFASQTELPSSYHSYFQHFPAKFASSVIANSRYLLDIPWKILSSIFLLTPGFMMITYLLFRNIPKKGIVTERDFYFIIIMALLVTVWGTLTFVSDNARYLTPFVILTYVSVLSTFWFKESENA